MAGYLVTEPEPKQVRGALENQRASVCVGTEQGGVDREVVNSGTARKRVLLFAAILINVQYHIIFH